MTRRLGYFLEAPSAESAYALDFLLRAAGVRAERLAAPSSADLYYGNHPPAGGGELRIRRAGEVGPGLHAEDVIWRDLLQGKIPPEADPREIPFDLIRATAFFLLDLGNTDAPRDAHDRVLAADSFQHRHGLLQLPVVNHYGLFLRERIERTLGFRAEPLWPGGKRCAIGLSHDVDWPDRRCIRNPARWLWAKAVRRLRCGRPFGFLYWLTEIAKLVARALFTPQDYWLFKPVMDEEEAHGARSAFYFHVRDLSDPAGHLLDVAYDVHKRKFRRVFKEMRRRGFEIGLHASYRAFESPRRFREERARLESVAGTAVSGLRHHFWHLGPDPERALKAHEEAGFTYDTSLAFNDRMGFRRSVAFPFRPWSPHEGAPVQTVQVPTFLMDGNLFYQPITAAEAVNRILQQISAIKAARGVGVIDWHVRSSLPLNEDYRDWGTAYREVLRALARDEEIWLAPPGEIAAFTRARWKSLGYD